MAKSLLDLAFDYISQNKGPVAFKDLWAYVTEQAGLDEATAAKKVSSFYTNLLIDGRFTTLGDNRWDLANRYTFDETHKDRELMLAYSDDDDSEEDEVDEDEEEKEYNKVFKETSDDSEDEELEEEEEADNDGEEER